MDELEEQLAQTEDAIEACEKIIQGIKIGVTQSRMPWISKGSPRESILCKKKLSTKSFLRQDSLFTQLSRLRQD